MACATFRTATSNASSVLGDLACTPLTLRTYCRAAASISSAVAFGCSPRRVVMLRHIRVTLGGERWICAVPPSRAGVWRPLIRSIGLVPDRGNSSRQAGNENERGPVCD